MPSFLVRIFNHKAYIIGAIIFAVVLGAVLLSDGSVDVVDAGFLAVYVVAVVGVWLLLRPQQSTGQDTLEQFKANLAAENKPTIVQFFSQYCVGCLAVKPVVDQLEREAGDRLQIIRLDIDEEPGKTLVEEYDIVYTPSFLYFDRNGNKLRDSTFILDRARVLYELEQA
jgi:thioredoxin 1